jgi:hypothetical protein
VNYAALGLGAVGLFAAVRALFRPYAAVVEDGAVTRCPGPEGGKCQPDLVIVPRPSRPSFLAVGRGVVMSSGPNWIHLVLRREPVVVSYSAMAGYGFRSLVGDGETVGAGQVIGEAGQVAFAVYRIERQQAGSLKFIPLEPSAWLASRGLRISGIAPPEASLDEWCEKGRVIRVPPSVGGCGLELPEPGGFALLPVSVSREK